MLPIEKVRAYPLHEACKIGVLEQVKALVEERWYDVNELDSEARDRGTSSRLIDKFGSFPCEPVYAARAPLHYAAGCGHTECCAYLLSKGANARYITGTTQPLQCAMESKNLEIVKLLVEVGKADPNVFVGTGSSILQMAIKNRTVHNIAAYFIEHCGMGSAYSTGSAANCALAAVEVKSPEILKLIISRGPFPISSALLECSVASHPASEQLLACLLGQFDVSVPLGNQRQLLDGALQKAATSSNVACCKLLLEHGASPVDCAYEAIIKGDVKNHKPGTLQVCQLLLEAGGVCKGVGRNDQPTTSPLPSHSLLGPQTAVLRLLLKSEGF